MHVVGSMAFRFSDTIVRFLPTLRLMARERCKSEAEADDIVASALSRAIAEVDRFDTNGYIEPWLISLLEDEFETRRYTTLQ